MYILKILTVLTVFLLFSMVSSMYIEITHDLNGDQWWNNDSIYFNADNIEYIKRYQVTCEIFYECYQKGYYKTSSLCSWRIDLNTCDLILQLI